MTHVKIEVIIGAIVAAAGIIGWLYKCGMLSFGKKGCVDVRLCSENIAKCAVEKKEDKKFMHSLKEAIVLQTQIVSDHEKKFDKVETKIDTISTDVKDLLVEIKVMKTKMEGS